MGVTQIIGKTYKNNFYTFKEQLLLIQKLNKQ